MAAISAWSDTQDEWAGDRAGCRRDGRPAPVRVFHPQAEPELTRLAASLASMGCHVRRDLGQNGSAFPSAERGGARLAAAMGASAGCERYDRGAAACVAG